MEFVTKHGEYGFNMYGQNSRNGKFSIHTALQNTNEVLSSFESSYNTTAHIRHDYQNFISKELDENSYFSEQHIEFMQNALLECYDIIKKALHHSIVLNFIQRPQRKTLHSACQEAQRTMDDPTESDDRKIEAQDSVNSRNFLRMGVLDHTSSCIGYAQYGACKHELWVTMKECGQHPSQ